MQLSFFTAFYQSFVYEFHFINMYSFLFIIIPIAYLVCSQLKNNYSKNYLTRNSYYKFKSQLFKTAYFSIWIIPMIVIIAFLICIFKTDNFLPNTTYTPWQVTTMEVSFAFMLLYLLNITLYSATYINIFLIAARKHHNFIIAIIISFLIFIAIELFLEIIINQVIFISLFYSVYGKTFNIMNAFTFNEQYHILITLGLAVFWFIISSFMVHFSYKNKERLIIDCEKNSQEVHYGN